MKHVDFRRGLARPAATPALLVLSHLRWDFVFQRPQHLMTRAARTRPVYYIEEPVFTPQPDHLVTRQDASGVWVVTPHIEAGRSPAESQACTARLLTELVRDEGLAEYDLWVYTPMELPVTAGLQPRVTVYDCMDELANFRGAPPELRGREEALFQQADLVFTGGHRLYEAKRERHPGAHPFPSSVDAAHFAQARSGLADPADQRDLPRPRLGFYGVLDERFDIDLIGELARRRPEWQFVLLGPVVKIDPADLPRAENLHYLGMKKYAELPAYLAHWDVALLPFALNEATEFISPTKTPEYLAAGVPVVSSGIRDVIRPYGERDLVRIADGVDAFEAACAAALAERGTAAGQARQERADAYLSTLSWDRTWADMSALIERAAADRGVLPLVGVAND
ncbi:glycosyltransferase family 1 protein [Deinococcus metallilatus]|uniref:Glycosyltransferase involved in cell wall biosynthesis n=1 Tax=Deinococcus metallilatus TaxID=1211322 RepID=A0ABR6MMQ1_9DEIO|nr:glycosyltransferase family 1 protein [Deinococcus metallilatus]MBB5293223.1 glycosyltransferase involved in cell wall biosynthesis [Deinococcus metallilatus]GMA15554.1 glycosyl transferase [Deinococcus metallilatus]